MKLRTMLNGTNRAGIFPPLHKAESSCEVTTIHLGVARLVDLCSMFSAAAIPLLLLICQLEEDVLKTDALGAVVQYRNAYKRFLSLRDKLCRNADLHVVVPSLMQDLSHRTRGNDLARSQYDHVVTHLLYLREKMAAQDNARAVIARDVSQEYEQLLLALRVQSQGGLVQKQEGRLVDERPGDAQSLPHPAAIGRYQGSRAVFQACLLQEARSALFGFRLSLAVEPAKVRQVFGAGYVLGEPVALRQDAYDLADLVRLVVGDASNSETTRSGLQDGR